MRKLAAATVILAALTAGAWASEAPEQWVRSASGQFLLKIPGTWQHLRADRKNGLDIYAWSEGTLVALELVRPRYDAATTLDILVREQYPGALAGPPVRTTVRGMPVTGRRLQDHQSVVYLYHVTRGQRAWILSFTMPLRARISPAAVSTILSSLQFDGALAETLADR
ncbi:MAG TPA: hypothetical protein VNO81_10275 [Candidatus Nitrosotenuis sp.]|jgi:hypothetical protein|nr:hypothetical protein [Candidatus Nitrosotenuis sp.]